MLIYLRRRAGKSLVIFLLPMMLASCSGSTNATGPAPPLPTGQRGSLTLWQTTNAGCYVVDNTACPTSPPPAGTNPITAVAAFSISSPPTSGSSSNYLVTGDGAGNVTAWTVPDSSSSLPLTFEPCPHPSSSSVQGVAATYTTTTVVYSVSAGVLYAVFSSTPCSSGTSSPINPIATTGSVVGLTVANGYVYGVSSGGKYFSIRAGTTSSSSVSPSPLPNLPSTAVIGGVTADANGLLFVTDYANSAIYAYYANSNGTLTRINGTLSGNVDVTNPKAITTVYAPYGTSSGCSATGPCEFLYVTNYSQAVVQLVLSISGSGPSTSIGYTEFNAPYTDCEIINPLSMASFVDVDASSNPLQAPWVFIGQNGKVSGPCQGLSSGTTFGNGVTAYNLTP